MAAIFGGTNFFWKLDQLFVRVTLKVKIFVEIAPSSTVFDIQAFLKKIRKFKMAAIFGKWNIGGNLERVFFTDTLSVKNLPKSH